MQSHRAHHFREAAQSEHWVSGRTEAGLEAIEKGCATDCAIQVPLRRWSVRHSDTC